MKSCKNEHSDRPTALKGPSNKDNLDFRPPIERSTPMPPEPVPGAVPHADAKASMNARFHGSITLVNVSQANQTSVRRAARPEFVERQPTEFRVVSRTKSRRAARRTLVGWLRHVHEGDASLDRAFILASRRMRQPGTGSGGIGVDRSSAV